MISWNEIRSRATKFAHDWAGETREQAEKQTFWNEFFQIFDIQRRSVGMYEKALEKLSGNRGSIDLFWPGTLIVEHKTAGKNLDSAYAQATDYFLALPEDERPRYIIVSDFQRIRLYDLDAEGEIGQQEFSLKDLPKYIRLFSFMIGQEVRRYHEENPVNRKAVRLVVQLYRALADSLYDRKYLEKLLVRLVFCFFADDTGIFNPRESFYRYLVFESRSDGNDFGGRLTEVFQILNTPIEQRQTNLDEDLAALPYVNGGLFAEVLPMPSFTGEMRMEVLKAAEFDWGAVSPAIFGSMFQFVMDAKDEDIRHDFGAHYTSERNILKVVDGLFMDELRAQFSAAGSSRTKLEALWERLADITLLDPACGCGNFLVVAYRELRRLELEIIKKLYKRIDEQQALPVESEVEKISKLSVEHMYGIELLTFPAEIAQLSLWLTDHLSNVELGTYFGKFFAKLPLLERPHIVGGTNALTTDWESIVSKSKLTYILGNPPFIGAKIMNDEQRKEIIALSGGEGTLDYVTGWYFKAAQYIQGTRITVGFVSTNSITQGEQVGILWQKLIVDYKVHILFAHRTFRWTNEAPGRAAVYCVIVGFGLIQPEHPRLFEYDDINGEPNEVVVLRINPYLVDAPDVFIPSRSKSLCDVPEMKIGNKPIDNGFYLFTPEQRVEFLEKEPQAAPFFRRWIGSEELINNIERWVLWLGECSPEQLRSMPLVMQRVEAVRSIRKLSKSKPTQKLADTPTRFHVENIPTTAYLVIPRVSSENRRYVPMGFFGSDVLTGDTCHTIPNSTLYHFGVLESEMHMTWMRAVCGRLESRYRYSKDIVYNNFPWPQEISAEHQIAVEQAAQVVLDARAVHSGATLADLYNPLTMPKDLLDAHHALDRAVDRAYGITKSFASESERLKFLFGLYKKYIQGEVL